MNLLVTQNIQKLRIRVNDQNVLVDTNIIHLHEEESLDIKDIQQLFLTNKIRYDV